jgi:hypothetical protein
VAERRTNRTLLDEPSPACAGAPLAIACAVTEEPLDRCAAYVAARGALAAIHRAATSWPDGLAGQARDAAIGAVRATAEGIGHAHASAGRRRCVRDALHAALELAATCDVARAFGFGNAALDEAHRDAGRAIAMLGLLLHANTLDWD